MARISATFSNAKAGMQLKDFIAMLLRRRWVILISFGTVVGSVIFQASRIPDVYESFATLVIEEQNPLIMQSMSGEAGHPLSFYDGIMNSMTFLDMVIDSIGMNIFAQDYPHQTRDNIRRIVQGGISLKNTSYASFLNFTARAKSKELAYLLASIGTDVFRKRVLEVETEESRRGVFEIEKQIDLIRTKLEQAEHDYRSYQEEQGNIAEGATPELQSLQSAYAADRSQLGVKSADLNAEKKQLELLESKITPSEQKQSPEYLKLRSKLSDLEKEKIRFENLGIKLSGASPVEREIEEIESQLLKYHRATQPENIDLQTMKEWQKLRESVLNKESEMELFKRRLESYRAAIENYKKGNPNLLAQSLELLRLKRSKEIYENIYNTLLQKSEEERVRSASSSIGIKIIDVARMPLQAIPKNQASYYLLSVLFGLILGLGLAFLLEFNDTTIKSNEDIERYLQLAVLGTIPHITYNKKEDIEIHRQSSSRKGMTVSRYPRHLLNFEGRDSVIAEAYRSLRTNLLFASPDNPLKTIAVTSSGPHEGKSITTSNLAIAYAQMGNRTLLIDTDLRRPILHHLFDVPREPGLSDLFIENPDFERAILPTPKKNLWLVTAGRFTPNPAELIGSQKMLTVIEYARAHFDMVFFDTPPIVAVTDATLLGTRTDGMLLVIRSHRTDRDIAMRAMHLLTNVGVKIVGSILNDIDLSHRYSSYGYYKYYYHYYKSKKD
ncbi:MAG: polysaccharide biosynthesis tyrosine autokinase [Chitinivibrionales bacterium]|nr:polysaccharide biosynthesis tyrosine autokinase [Chitinivibrionales bacterium]